MKAHPIHLQMKYARIVEGLSYRTDLSLDDAPAFFYGFRTCQLVRKGVSGLHARSDGYLVGEPPVARGGRYGFGGPQTEAGRAKRGNAPFALRIWN